MLKKIAAIITIVYILFLALFAFDSFAPGKSFTDNLTGFIIHLIPNFVLVGLLLLSLKYPRAGGILFSGLFLIAFAFFKGNSLLVQLMLFSPLVLVGGLFFISDLKTAK